MGLSGMVMVWVPRSGMVSTEEGSVGVDGQEMRLLARCVGRRCESRMH